MFNNSRKSKIYGAITIFAIIVLVGSVVWLSYKIKKVDNFKVTKNLKERFKMADQGTINSYDDLIKAETNYKKDLKSEGDAYSTSKSNTDTKVSQLLTDYSSINTAITSIVNAQSKLTSDVASFDSMITGSATAASLAAKSVELQGAANSILTSVNSALTQITPLQARADAAKTSANDTLSKATAYSSTVSEGAKILNAFTSLQQYKDTDSSVKGASTVITDAQKALTDKKVEKDDISIIQHGIDKVTSTITKITDILKSITSTLEVGQTVKDQAKKQVDDVNAVIADIADKTRLLVEFNTKANENFALINARISDLNISTNIFNSNSGIDTNYNDLNNFYNKIK